MLFRPLGPEVIISLHGVAYAEYRCAVDRPLVDRFVVPLRIPARLVATLADDLLIEFLVGSHLRMVVGGNEFLTPLANADKMPAAPKVSEGVTFAWDAGILIQELKAAIASTATGGGGSPLESVNIEVLPARETIVASDGRRLSVYERKANSRNGVRRSDDIHVRALIHRSAVALILSTCKSMGRVDVRSGLSHLMVECGRRKAIIPAQEGAFPQWREPLAGLLERPASRISDINRGDFIRAIRQVKGDADQSSGAVSLRGRDGELLFSARSEDGESMSRAVIPVGKNSEAFGPISVGAKYLLAVATNWPELMPIAIEYRGAASPLVFKRVAFSAFVMPMLGESETETETETEQNGDISAGVVASV